MSSSRNRSPTRYTRLFCDCKGAGSKYRCVCKKTLSKSERRKMDADTKKALKRMHPSPKRAKTPSPPRQRLRRVSRSKSRTKSRSPSRTPKPGRKRYVLRSPSRSRSPKVEVRLRAPKGMACSNKKRDDCIQMENCKWENSRCYARKGFWGNAEQKTASPPRRKTPAKSLSPAQAEEQVNAIMDFLEEHWDKFGEKLKQMVRPELVESVAAADTIEEYKSVLTSVWREFGRFLVVLLEKECSKQDDCSFPYDAMVNAKMFTRFPETMYAFFNTVQDSTDTEFNRGPVFPVDPDRGVQVVLRADDLKEAKGAKRGARRKARKAKSVEEEEEEDEDDDAWIDHDPMEEMWYEYGGPSKTPPTEKKLAREAAKPTERIRFEDLPQRMEAQQAQRVALFQDLFKNLEAEVEEPRRKAPEILDFEKRRAEIEAEYKRNKAARLAEARGGPAVVPPPPPPLPPAAPVVKKRAALVRVSPGAAAANPAFKDLVF